MLGLPLRNTLGSTRRVFLSYVPKVLGFSLTPLYGYFRRLGVLLTAKGGGIPN